MLKAFSVACLLALVSAAAGSWSDSTRERVRVVAAINFASLPQGEALANCVTNELERAIPEDEALALLDGKRSPLPAQLLRECACNIVKVPEAIAEPGYCKPADSIDI